MKRAVALIALSVLARASARADEPTDLRETADLFASATLAPVSRVAELPPDVALTLGVRSTFWMADPGESWNPGCVHDSSHPEADRRLIIAGKSPSLVAVQYETGGRGKGTVLELLRVSPEGRVVLRCSYHSGAPPKPSLTELRDSFPAEFGAGRCTSQNPS